MIAEPPTDVTSTIGMLLMAVKQGQLGEIAQWSWGGAYWSPWREREPYSYQAHGSQTCKPRKLRNFVLGCGGGKMLEGKYLPRSKHFVQLSELSTTNH